MIWALLGGFAIALIGFVAFNRLERWLDSPAKPYRPAPEYIDRPKTCANGVDGCGIKRKHSHTADLIRRIRGK
jgi:hypothetical protein